MRVFSVCKLAQFAYDSTPEHSQAQLSISNSHKSALSFIWFTAVGV